MCAKLFRNRKKKQGQTLSYPLAIRSEANHQIIRTLLYAQAVTKKYLCHFYQRDTLDLLGDGLKKAYKLLESRTPSPWNTRIPSRVNRGILEVAGRILRTVNARRKLFDLLVQTFGQSPSAWSYKKLIEQQQIYIKSQYITNIAEQTKNFFLAQDEYPQDFLQLQTAPTLHDPMITYAPDDGQAIRMEKNGDHLDLSLKVLVAGTSKGKPEWEWVKLAVPLPPFLWSGPALAPDLRLANIHGQLLPVLDYKIQIEGAKKQTTPYFLTVDWGVRKLITLGVFDKQGQQVCPPVFLQFEPVQKKLQRLRNEIDRLKAQRDSLPQNSSLWKKYNREIAKRWRKFRAIQKELAHLASNVIVLIAQIYNCSEIYVEWLKSLKSHKYSHNLNWLINTTVREAIYTRVAYKASLLGIALKRPVQPYGTSQYCPRCGKHGIHTKSPNLTAELKSGGWFWCLSCGFNADRDYVACCNLARKVLYGNLRDLSKGIAYTASPISESLFRQSKLPGKLFPRERLRRHLRGWAEALSLTPQRHFCGTLRS